MLAGEWKVDSVLGLKTLLCSAMNAEGENHLLNSSEARAGAVPLPLPVPGRASSKALSDWASVHSMAGASGHNRALTP